MTNSLAKMKHPFLKLVVVNLLRENLKWLLLKIFIMRLIEWSGM